MGTVLFLAAFFLVTSQTKNELPQQLHFSGMHVETSVHNGVSCLWTRKPERKPMRTREEHADSAKKGPPYRSVYKCVAYTA